MPSPRALALAMLTWGPQEEPKRGRALRGSRLDVHTELPIVCVQRSCLDMHTELAIACVQPSRLDVYTELPIVCVRGSPFAPPPPPPQKKKKKVYSLSLLLPFLTLRQTHLPIVQRHNLGTRSSKSSASSTSENQELSGTERRIQDCDKLRRRTVEKIV